MFTRILALADPAADDVRAGAAGQEPGWRSNLRWFGLFLFVHMGMRSILNFPKSGDVLDEMLYVGAILTAVVGCTPAFARGATRFAAAFVLAQLLRSLPDSANHVYLEVVLFSLLALLDPADEDESRLLLQALRWFVAIFFFYTGVQKVLYGQYFDGQFLAYMAATEERFTLFFQYLIPADELARLQAFNEVALPGNRFQVATDAGPYRVDAPFFVLMSNLVYLFELAAGVLLMVPRARSVTAVLVIGFVLLIELGARELTFGVLMVNLALLFLSGPWIKKLFPVCVAIYVYLALADGGGAGVLPMFWYSPA